METSFNICVTLTSDKANRQEMLEDFITWLRIHNMEHVKLNQTNIEFIEESIPCHLRKNI